MIEYKGSILIRKQVTGYKPIWYEHNTGKPDKLITHRSSEFEDYFNFCKKGLNVLE